MKTKLIRQMTAVLLIAVLLLPCWAGGEALAASGLTAYVDSVYGNSCVVNGQTVPGTAVTFKVVRTSDLDVVHTDEMNAGSDGGYEFVFSVPAGSYKAIVTAIGLSVERSLSVNDLHAGQVSVRVEGMKSTLLPEYWLDVEEGHTTYSMAVFAALEANGVQYTTDGNHGVSGIGPELEGNNGEGTESWQWMVNGKGGQILPTDYVKGSDSIVLVPGGLWNPTITRLSVSPESPVAVGTMLTAKLEQYNADMFGDVHASAAPGQPIRFAGNSGVTSDDGTAQFGAAAVGEYEVTCEPKLNAEGNPLIRPVPVKVTVKAQGDIDVDKNIVHLSVDAKTIGKGTLLEQNVEYQNGDTAYSVLERAIGKENLKTTSGSMGVYVASMRFSSTGWLGEFDNGQGSGWMINVNGKYINISAGRYRVEPGDKVNWRYTTNYGKDLGAEVAGSPSSTSAAGASAEDIKNKTLRDMLKEVMSGGLSDSQIAAAAEQAVTDVISRANMDSVSADKAKELASDLNITASVLIDTVKDVSSIQGALKNIVDASGKLADKMEAADSEAARIAMLNTAKKAINKKSTVEVKGTTVKVTADSMQAADSFNQAIIKALKDAGIEPVRGRSPQSEITFNFEGGKVVIPAGSLTDKDRSVSLRTDEGVTDIKVEPSVGGIVKVYLPTAVTGNQATVIMTDAKGNEINVGGVYDAATGMMVFIVSGSGKYRIEENKVTFSDLAGYDWAREYIEAMAAKGIINGKSEGIYDPAGKVKRAEFAAMLVRAVKVGGKVSGQFSDVSSDDWFAEAVAAAVQSGLMQGKGEGRFDPNGSITRQELAVAMANVLKSLGFTGQGSTGAFKDRADIASWAEEGVALAAEYGLIVGDSQGNFNPTAAATRAEAAVMMARLYELMMR